MPPAAALRAPPPRRVLTVGPSCARSCAKLLQSRRALQQHNVKSQAQCDALEREVSQYSHLLLRARSDLDEIFKDLRCAMPPRRESAADRAAPSLAQSNVLLLRPPSAPPATPRWFHPAVPRHQHARREVKQLLKQHYPDAFRQALQQQQQQQQQETA